MFRPIAVVVWLALLAGGCGDGDVRDLIASEEADDGPSTTSPATGSPTTSTTTTSTSAPTTVPPTSPSTTTTVAPVQSDLELTYTPASTEPGWLLVHDRASVFVVDPSADPPEPQVVLGPLDGLVVDAARVAADGSLVVGLHDDTPLDEPLTGAVVVLLGADGSIVDLAHDAVLYDVAVFGGEEQALVGEVWDGSEADEAHLLAVPLDGRPPVAFGTAFAPEYGVGSIDVVDELAVVSAFADLTEVVQYTDFEGDEIVLPSPTDGLGYAEAPLVTNASLSPNRSEVAWIEGPDQQYDADVGQAVWVGDWRVLSLDLATGEERISWPFEFPGEDPAAELVTGLAHGGDMLVVSRGVAHEGLVFDIEILVLDLTTEEPELRELPVAGVADVIG